MSGGSRETVLKELIVMPWAFLSVSRQVITVTPVAKEEKPLRSSCGVNGVISSCLFRAYFAAAGEDTAVGIVVPGIGVKTSFSSALTHLKRYSLPALERKLAPW